MGAAPSRASAAGDDDEFAFAPLRHAATTPSTPPSAAAAPLPLTPPAIKTRVGGAAAPPPATPLPAVPSQASVASSASTGALRPRTPDAGSSPSAAAAAAATSPPLLDRPSLPRLRVARARARSDASEPARADARPGSAATTPRSAGGGVPSGRATPTPRGGGAAGGGDDDDGWDALSAAADEEDAGGAAPWTLEHAASAPPAAVAAPPVAVATTPPLPPRAAARPSPCASTDATRHGPLTPRAAAAAASVRPLLERLREIQDGATPRPEMTPPLSPAWRDDASKPASPRAPRSPLAPASPRPATPRQPAGAAAAATTRSSSHPSSASAALARSRRARATAAVPPSASRGLSLVRAGGVTLMNRFAVIKYLGRGACGRVYLVLDAADCGLYAAKVVKRPRGGATPSPHPRRPPTPPAASPRSPRGEAQVQVEAAASQQHPPPPPRDLRREVGLMRRAPPHPNVVALRDVVDDPAGGRALIVMDYCEGGPILARADLDRRRRVAEGVARSAFRGLVAGLAHLHAHRVVHGDVKPENVLVGADGAARLSDFGCAKLVRGGGDDACARVDGTPAFLAPEAVGPPGTVYHGRAADVYALGATLYTLAFGRIPFAAPTVAALFQLVKSEPLRFPPDVPASPALKDLLARMLAKDPASRLTLAGAAAHPWTLGGDGTSPPAPPRPLPPAPSDAEAALAALAAWPAPPRKDVLLDELVTPDAPRVAFEPGATLQCAGDPATRVYFILTGAVEILLAPSCAAGGVAAGPHVDGAAAAAALTPDAAAAVRRARGLARAISRPGGRYVVAHRRGGAFVGDASALAPGGVALTTAVAVGRVDAVALPARALRALVDADAEARQQSREVAWSKAAERLVVEALARLADVGAALDARARPASARW